MTISIDSLSGLADLQACEKAQAAILGRSTAGLPGISILRAISDSSGLILGARADSSSGSPLTGVLVDLAAEIDGFPSYVTIFHGVSAENRNRGIASKLRLAERKEGRRKGIGLVRWEMDPLRSTEAHIALNRLAAIGTSYARNIFGDSNDPPDHGLPTDRLRMEWWLESPRVISLLDRKRPAPHLSLGLHEMDVLTKTRSLSHGIRSLEGFRQSPQGPYVLAEIPVDLDAVRTYDLAVAHAWRTGIRELLELLLSNGYVVVGFVHEGGRSFHLLEKADRGHVLGRA